MMRRMLPTALALLLAGCATAPSPGEADAEPQSARGVISAQDIQEMPITTAWELVSRLRPQWMRSRGPTSMRGGGPEYPVVYVDQVRSGGPEALQRISSLAIAQIRFISGRDAATRLGLNHGAGAIMVTTNRDE